MAGCIRSLNIRQHRPFELGLRQCRFQRADGLGDSRIQDQATDWSLTGTLEAGEVDGRWRAVGIQHGAAADFGPIMVFRVDPEHRHDGNTMFTLDLCRELHRGDRLQYRKHRTTEESRLLACDDHDGARVGQAIRGAP